MDRDDGDLMMKTGLINRLRIRIFGRVYTGQGTREGWPGELPFYMARCKKHGIFEDYLHGNAEYLMCPECLKDGE